MSALFSARALGRRRADRQGWLLRGISVEVHAGDRVAVAGSSGAGKTLLLRAMSLLDPIDEGEVLWNDRPVANRQVNAFRSQVVYLHQRASLVEGSVEDVLRSPFLLYIHRQQQFDRDRVLDWLTALGRDAGFLSKWSGDLSGGEAQIVALLRVLQLDPAVLLLDEPTAAMDAATTHAAEQLVERWVADAANRRATVWVSHDAQKADRAAQRVIKLSDGQLVEEI